MSAARLRHEASEALVGQAPAPLRGRRSNLPAKVRRREDKLAGLSSLSTLDIESPFVANLSGELHALFDPVSDDALPIYFGPLLGRLYLAGL